MYLNLAHNAITAEDSVVFTSEIHSLQKLVLYGNPLAHAAVFSHDRSKLAYDPVPAMTAHVAANGLPLEIVVAYPATKRTTRTAKSSYENVEIYKMIPNEVSLQPPFRTKATDFMLAESDRSDGKREVRWEREKKRETTVCKESYPTLLKCSECAAIGSGTTEAGFEAYEDEIFRLNFVCVTYNPELMH